jgi:hypothetical protein
VGAYVRVRLSFQNGSSGGGDDTAFLRPETCYAVTAKWTTM